jgi:hypothetical protein
MEHRMASLTHEQQALLGAIGFAGMSTTRTRLAGRMGVHLDGQRATQARFVGNHAVQFGKAPCGRLPVCTTLLVRGVRVVSSIGTLSDIGQVFQSNDHDGFHPLYGLIVSSVCQQEHSVEVQAPPSPPNKGGLFLPRLKDLILTHILQSNAVK